MSVPGVPLEKSTPGALAMSEADLARRIRDTNHDLGLGWRLAHFRAAQTAHGWRTPVEYDGAGFPDLLMVNAERGLVLFRELKTQRGKLRTEQYAWLDDLEQAGADAKVWRPSDLPEIIWTLTAGRGALQ